ncbi:MAG: farnesyl-diphosphate farnesyltransferase [Gemmatimonadetes bacterium]|nr:farnesyl-diphosphate farnesyltransferase [Gemmatimonadota bacterium]
MAERGDANGAGDTPEAARRFAREILPAVSRTFALSIRMLPGPLGDAVLAAYLLCRIADTVEDDPVLPADHKARLLDRLAACFDAPGTAAAFASEASILSGDEAHLRLVSRSALVFALYESLPVGTQRHVRKWVCEMIVGMRKFVLLYPRGIRIQTLEEYKEYCYYVAGTVGYMLTDLWHEHAPSIDDALYSALRERSRAFAEALQTVNILKDVAVDAEKENSIYVPQQLLQAHGSSHAALLSPDLARETREAMTSLVELAWSDLEQARIYLLAIPRRAWPIRAFCVLPLLFAYATLRDFTRLAAAPADRRVVKITRAEVKSLTLLGMMGIMSNSALDRLIRRSAKKKLELRWV